MDLTRSQVLWYNGLMTTIEKMRQQRALARSLGVTTKISSYEVVPATSDDLDRLLALASGGAADAVEYVDTTDPEFYEGPRWPEEPRPTPLAEALAAQHALERKIGKMYRRLGRITLALVVLAATLTLVGQRAWASEIFFMSGVVALFDLYVGRHFRGQLFS